MCCASGVGARPGTRANAAQPHESGVRRRRGIRVDVAARRRAHAVGPDEHVAHDGASVGEDRAYRGIRLLDPLEPGPERDRDAGLHHRLAKHLVQDAAAHHDAAAFRVARGPVGHRAEALARARPHDHLGRAVPRGHEPIAQAQSVEHGQAVRGDVEEEARVGVGLCGGLEDLDVPSGTLEEERGGRTGDAASDDERAWHGMLLL